MHLHNVIFLVGTTFIYYVYYAKYLYYHNISYGPPTTLNPPKNEALGTKFRKKKFFAVFLKIVCHT